MSNRTTRAVSSHPRMGRRMTVKPCSSRNVSHFLEAPFGSWPSEQSTDTSASNKGAMDLRIAISFFDSASGRPGEMAELHPSALWKKDGHTKVLSEKWLLSREGRAPPGASAGVRATWR